VRRVNLPGEFYERVHAIGQHFNRVLFDDALPTPLYTLRRGAGGLGHFAANRWCDENGRVIAEISLSPELFAHHTWLMLMQTMAQQQCHLWQHVHGEPSRPGYHNAEWAAKMESIGLIPSSTGMPGGRRTGQAMSAYPIAAGKFVRACADLADGTLRMPVAMRWGAEVASPPPPVPIGLPRAALRRLLSPIGTPRDDALLVEGQALRDQKRKVKYSCPGCAMNVWGRPGLRLRCGDCDARLREAAVAVPARSAARAASR
jgi:hypothetical protein